MEGIFAQGAAPLFPLAAAAAGGPTAPLTGVEQGLLLVLVLLIAGVITLLGMLGYRRQLAALDEEEYIAQARRRLDAELESLAHLINGTRPRLRACQDAVSNDIHLLSTGATLSLGSAVRVLSAMEERLAAALEHLKANTGRSLAAAEELCARPFTFQNTAVESISGSAIPDIGREHLEGTLNTLLSRIEREISDRKKVA